MFREMRRKKQQLTKEETDAILVRGSSGTLALAGDDGYPYALPISYVYQNDRLYFHSAVTGHKIDAIRRCARASFCVIDQDRVVAERYTTLFRSAIVFGTIRILEKAEEKRSAMEALAAKYAPEDIAGRKSEIEQSWERFCMIELTPEHCTGKEAIELRNGKE